MRNRSLVPPALLLAVFLFPPPSPSQSQAGRVVYSDLAPTRSVVTAESGQFRPARSIATATSPERPAQLVNTFVVTNTLDDGAGSLRSAIESANYSPGWDLISLEIPVPGIATILLSSPLPEITDPVNIDGTYQSGYSGTPRVAIDGSLAGVANGLVLVSDFCTVRGLAITRFSKAGIGVIGNFALIEGCFVGVDPNGTSDGGNGEDGIIVRSSGNRIGNRTGARNVISGNGRSGVWVLTANDNRVENCYIGTNASGTGSVKNDNHGILLQNSARDTVGGSVPSAMNVISGNGQSGIHIAGAASHDIVIQGNRIGTTVAGNDSLANLLHGIEVGFIPGTPGTPYNIRVGGTVPDEGNLISGNMEVGVGFFCDNSGGYGNVIAGNRIGTDVTEKKSLRNSIGIFVTRSAPAAGAPGIRIGGVDSDSGNVISGNRVFGIWLKGSGTANNRIQGNYIGTTREVFGAIAKLGNGEAGIMIDDAPLNTVGDASPTRGNVIGGNGLGGIAVKGTQATGNIILNNWIGTNSADAFDLGNGTGGIYIEASNTTVGGVGKENTIANNTGAGISVFSGTRNTFRHNVWHDNDSLGINLGIPWVTANDSLDLDGGPNNLVNFPVLDSARILPSAIRICGHYSGEPNTNIKIDFYVNDTREPSKFGEGKAFLGEWTFTTDGDGNTIPFCITFSRPVTEDQFLSAMATDADGNSSEFTRAMGLKDTDGDGLLDVWELDGIDINADNLVDIDLAQRGARVDHKDLFVEVDRMEGIPFSEQALLLVLQAFDAVPNALVHNPDGRDGIALRIEYDTRDSLQPRNKWKDPPWAEFFALKNSPKGWGTRFEQAHPNAKYMLEAKRLAYRYCIVGDEFGTRRSSGKGEMWGNDFLVTLGWETPAGGTIDQQAGTFMHELGHTLGLRHGGGDSLVFKPNYFSVMNYTWQWPQWEEIHPNTPLYWRLDYSHYALPPLNENVRLDESVGLNPSPGEFVAAAIFPYNGPANAKRIGVFAPATEVDWDGSGDSSGSASQLLDVNWLDGPATPGEVLTGYADWPNLRYNFLGSPVFSDPGAAPPGTIFPSQGPDVEELTKEMYDSLQALPRYGFIPAHRIPTLVPPETSVIGGNGVMLRLGLAGPVPQGGATFYLKCSRPDIVSVPSSVFLPEGWTGINFGIESRGVEQDTVVRIEVESTVFPAVTSVTVRPARLNGLAALADSGCTVTQAGGFLKKYMAGAAILFEAKLDGEAPPLGSTGSISTTRPDLVTLPSSLAFPSYAQKGKFAIVTDRNVTSEQQVVVTATYRGISISDTVTLIPAPRYVLEHVTLPGYGGSSTMKINNAGDLLIGDYLRHDGVFTPVNSLSFPGLRLTGVKAINDSAWLLGGVWDSVALRGVPAYWKPDTTIVLNRTIPGYPSSGAFGFNNKGDVVGVCVGSSYPYPRVPVMWRGDSVMQLGGYNDFDLWAVDVNDNGHVAGSGKYYRSFPYTNLEIAFSWENGTLTPIYNPSMGSDFWVGSVTIASDGTLLLWDRYSYFFLWKPGGATTLPPLPPYNRMEPHDMNDSLEVVGELELQSEEMPARYSGFVLTGGYLYDIACFANFPPTWERPMGVGINNSGVILGYAQENGEPRYFLLVPEGLTSAENERKRTAIPEHFELLQNYPNPFNPTTVVRYQMPVASTVELVVYDVLGREVAVLVNERKPAGTYEVRFDASRLASGVYFYRLHARQTDGGQARQADGGQRGDFVQSRKMMILK